MLRGRWPRLDRYSRPLWEEVINIPTDFIPLHLLEWFEDPIPDALVANDGRPFFEEPGWDLAIADRTGLTFKDADAAALEAARDFARSSERNLFVSLVQLDRLGHLHGCPSQAVEAASKFAVEAFQELIRIMDQRGRLSSATLLSDHGMSNTTRVVRCELESLVPRCGQDWLCYYDSLYLKVWAEDQRIISQVEDILAGLPGDILTSEQRTKLGVTRRSFGDILFVLHEGNVFAPNFFARRAVRGYHGYVRYGDNQLGAFISTKPVQQSVLTPIEAYGVLTE